MLLETRTVASNYSARTVLIRRFRWMFKNVSTGVLIQNLASVQYNPYVNCDSEQLEYICRYMYDLVSIIILAKRNEYVCVTEFERRSKIKIAWRAAHLFESFLKLSTSVAPRLLMRMVPSPYVQLKCFQPIACVLFVFEKDIWGSYSAIESQSGHLLSGHTHEKSRRVSTASG